MDPQVGQQNYESHLINSSMHYMKLLSPDDILEQREPQSKTSKRELELRIQDGIKQALYIKNSMWLPDNVLHYILNEVHCLEAT